MRIKGVRRKVGQLVGPCHTCRGFGTVQVEVAESRDCPCGCGYTQVKVSEIRRQCGTCHGKGLTLVSRSGFTA